MMILDKLILPPAREEQLRKALAVSLRPALHLCTVTVTAQRSQYAR